MRMNLKSFKGSGTGFTKKSIKWNFTKFLVDGKEILARFSQDLSLNQKLI